MPDDLLLKIKSAAEDLRNKRLEIEQLEEQLAQAKAEQREIQRTVLPDLMAQAGMPKMTIAAEGNYPAYDIEVKPFARANIASGWPEERREAAFSWLTQNGGGDLIKTNVTIDFPRDQHDEATQLIERLHHLGFRPHVDQAVHHGTLGKWLKEIIRRGVIVPLDVIGGEVGMEASIKEKD